ncbi:hypothetical protein CAOG_03997 [Capsaspora owczarzaki ATCC 30864]|uniref:Uncharacterized protein n=1 Tax=Capsaspora owczarzaki (strain ATCC 30864) TaxID=595528 RepID=A0A0D2UDP5_CAPO3|nr:hypothetical protein CAOG_03997 [Capsaspora owczarzaki ATCC 30864]KJE93171.1 hypothetical protein CAOG_003997 [Capsaspora owczarzaki ATCC 30864]|eukprot:XP_004347822.1 hypothetical protein CAOG_03997 [Capsaspora owczarzaki ATCC 30864]
MDLLADIEAELASRFGSTFSITSSASSAAAAAQPAAASEKARVCDAASAVAVESDAASNNENTSPQNNSILAAESEQAPSSPVRKPRKPVESLDPTTGRRPAIGTLQATSPASPTRKGPRGIPQVTSPAAFESGVPISQKVLLACLNNCPAELAVLLQVKTISQNTLDESLRISAAFGHTKCALLLVQRGSNTNSRADDNSTVLHFACRKADVELVQAVLQHDADVGARDDDYVTPLDIAAEQGLERIVALLLDRAIEVAKHSKPPLSASDLILAESRAKNCYFYQCAEAIGNARRTLYPVKS